MADTKTHSNSSDPWFNTRGLAAHSDMSTSYWEKLRARGDGPKWVYLGRAARTQRSWADAYIEAQRSTGGQEAPQIRNSDG